MNFINEYHQLWRKGVLKSRIREELEEALEVADVLQDYCQNEKERVRKVMDALVNAIDLVKGLEWFCLMDCPPYFSRKKHSPNCPLEIEWEPWKVKKRRRS